MSVIVSNVEIVQCTIFR